MIPGRYDRQATTDKMKGRNMDNDAKTLKREIKQLIITALKISDVTPDDIEDGAPIFGNPKLGLDSLDALQLAMAVEERFGVTIPEGEPAKEIFASVSAIARHIETVRSAGA